MTVDQATQTSNWLKSSFYFSCLQKNCVCVCVDEKVFSTTTSWLLYLLTLFSSLLTGNVQSLLCVGGQGMCTNIYMLDVAYFNWKEEVFYYQRVGVKWDREREKKREMKKRRAQEYGRYWFALEQFWVSSLHSIVFVSRFDASSHSRYTRLVVFLLILSALLFSASLFRSPRFSLHTILHIGFFLC